MFIYEKKTIYGRLGDKLCMKNKLCFYEKNKLFLKNLCSHENLKKPKNGDTLINKCFFGVSTFCKKETFIKKRVLLFEN